MTKEKYILFTAGRGPQECGMAVYGVQKCFQKYLNSKNVAFEIVSKKLGACNKSIVTIVFKIKTIDKALTIPWVGTIQWICQSPIRKSHKRKNWYIKCEEITSQDSVDTNISDVTLQSYRASGPGGQHRNKVETAIRIIHNPTGLIVTASDGKSQAQNKKKAWQKLKDRLRIENEKRQNLFNADQWISQIEIERGNPIKTFKGPKFIEQ